MERRAWCVSHCRSEWCMTCWWTDRVTACLVDWLDILFSVLWSCTIAYVLYLPSQRTVTLGESVPSIQSSVPRAHCFPPPSLQCQAGWYCPFCVEILSLVNWRASDSSKPCHELEMTSGYSTKRGSFSWYSLEWISIYTFSLPTRQSLLNALRLQEHHSRSYFQ